MPAEVIRRLAARAGITPLSIPTEEAGGATNNRRTALGAISGYTIGTLIGTFYGAIAERNPGGGTLRVVALGALAMAASDVPATLLGATDIARWTVDSWISDIVPHLAYGFVTAGAFAAMAGAD
jgi:predicted TIM-barrel enzyme